MMSPRTHGGPDALGVPKHDFSTCGNACGPCPLALQAVRAADACHYPDASYADLRARLANFHGVTPERVLLAASASEFIQRVTAAVAHQANANPGQASGRIAPCAAAAAVFTPHQAYSDYDHAASAWGLLRVTRPDDAALVWACEPSSPLGQAHTDWPVDLARLVVVLDSAYAPLRLSGELSLSAAQLDQVWQLYTPNKALGLTGVRGAYVLAPLQADATEQASVQAQAQTLQSLAPSWPVGAHGVAMLQAWVQPEVQAWLAASRDTLRAWKARQVGLLERLGWTCLPSDANYFCAQAPQALNLDALRHIHGIKLRDATSFGLPGWFRLAVLPAAAQDALEKALTSSPNQS